MNKYFIRRKECLDVLFVMLNLPLGMRGQNTEKLSTITKVMLVVFVTVYF